MKKLGPYNLDGILGRGGMGTVYRANHHETGEQLAVKVLAPYYSNDEHFRSRFESEIKALIKLDHQNIVRLISYGQEETNLFFAMELVEGKSLFQLQRDGKKFDWREVLTIARHVAQGLRHAHDRGVIHRDLKPGNLLQSNDNIVKITDFGIAKNFGTSQNTGNNVLGTMDFMSPEQAKGQPVTVRSDLYSLGTLMYTLLAGATPFSGNSVEESLRNLTRVPAPHICEKAPDVPDELDELISMLMQKRPADRIQTAQSLLYQIDAIESLLRDYSEAQTAERPQGSFSNDTFEIGAPSTSESKPSSDPEKTKQLGNTAIEPGRLSDSGSKPDRTALATVADQTVEFDNSKAKSESVAQDSGAQIDYFNTVTEQQRARQAAGLNEKIDPSWRGRIAIGAPLFLILVIAVYGIIRVYQTPSAEALYATIQKQQAAPYRVLEEINLFLEHYPENEHFSEIEQLEKNASAMALYNRLAVQKNARNSNGLNEIELRFVNAVDLSYDDPAAAFIRFGAMVTVYEAGGELSLRESKCFEAIKSYQSKIKSEASRKVVQGEERILELFKRASESNRSEANEIYRAIVQLYENATWAQEHVVNAKKKLAEPAPKK